MQYISMFGFSKSGKQTVSLTCCLIWSKDLNTDPLLLHLMVMIERPFCSPIYLPFVPSTQQSLNQALSESFADHLDAREVATSSGRLADIPSGAM